MYFFILLEEDNISINNVILNLIKFNLINIIKILCCNEKLVKRSRIWLGEAMFVFFFI